MFPPELVYNTTVAKLVAVTYQSWSLTTSTENLSHEQIGLLCSLLLWINTQYQTQRRWAIWRFNWQARQGQPSLEWALLDSSTVLHGTFWRGNLEGLKWSLAHNLRVFAKQINQKLITQKVSSVSQLLFTTLWMCPKSTRRLVICNRARHYMAVGKVVKERW